MAASKVSQDNPGMLIYTVRKMSVAQRIPGLPSQENPGIPMKI